MTTEYDGWQEQDDARRAYYDAQDDEQQRAEAFADALFEIGCAMARASSDELLHNV